MGQISYQIPQIGQPNSTENPKVDTALTALLTLVNGNIDTNNISPTAAITAAQLAAGAMFLLPRVVTVSGSIISGTLANCAQGITVTLPAPTAGSLVALYADVNVTGAAPVTIAASGGATIFGPGVSGASNAVLGAPNAYMVLLAGGSDWITIAGRQDTGWVGVALETGITGPVSCASRVVGTTVMLKGLLQNETGGTVGGFSSPLCQVAVAARPVVEKYLPQASPNTGATACQITTGGLVSTFGNITNTQFVSLDGIVYSLD